MKRILTLLIIILFLHNFISAQKVDSIKVEQSGDFIKIRYKILDSRPGDIFRVKVLASINGGLKTELESVSGDAGDQVPGGKAEYWVVWDVLKDVSEVSSADFIIRADLVNKAAPVKKKSDKIVNLQACFQVPGPGFGARLGIMGRFGASFQFISAKPALVKEPLYNENPRFMRFSAGLTSRLALNENVQVHLLTGFSIGNTVIKETYNNGGSTEIQFKKAMTPGPEIGLFICTRSLIFGFSGTRLLTGMTEDGASVSKNTYGVLSAGFRF